jgi:hypothetical protein
MKMKNNTLIILVIIFLQLFFIVTCDLEAWVEDTSLDADYLVYVHSSLYNSTWSGRLDSLLTARGFHAGLTVIEDGVSYSEIAQWINEAYYQGVAARYVLFIGNGRNLPTSEDDPYPQSRRGWPNYTADAATGNFIPYYYERMIAWDPDSIDIPSDDGYISSLTGNGDIAIGRIPAYSLVEVENYIDKLVEYYRSLSIRGDWKNDELFIGHDLDVSWGLLGWRVRSMTDSVLKYTPSYIDTIILYSSLIDSTTPQQQSADRDTAFENNVNRGVFLINAFGTGSDSKNLVFFYFNRGISAYNFTNAGMYPFLVANCCDLGEMMHPDTNDYPSVVHDLMFTQSGGIIGAFAPSIMTSQWACREWSEDFHRSLYDAGVGSAGDLIKITKSTFEARMPTRIWHSRSMILFGEPSMPLALVSQPPPPGNFSAVGYDGEVHLSWDAVNWATSYKVYRGNRPGFNPGDSTLIGEVTDLNFIDSEVSNATDYYYLVLASNSYGEGEQPPEDEARPRALGDIDGNGCIVSTDVQLLEDYLAGQATFDEEEYIAADVNQSGEVDNWDLEILRGMVPEGIYTLCDQVAIPYPSGSDGDLYMELGIGSGAPRASGVQVPLYLNNDTSTVRDLYYQVKWDTTVLSLAGYVLTPRAEGMSLIDNGCPPKGMPRPLALAGDGGANISPGNGTVAYLKVDVAPGTPSGSYHLDVHFSSLLGLDGTDLVHIPLRGKFYVPSFPPVSIISTPIRDTTITPGDTLIFNTTLTNPGDSIVSPRVFIYGTTTGPNSFAFLAVDTATVRMIPPGGRRSSVTYLEVPQGVPEGHYVFTASAAFYNNVVYDTDDFGFRVHPSYGKPGMNRRRLALEGGGWDGGPWRVINGWFGEEGGDGQATASPLPKAFSLSQNYPNPFNPSTTIEFTVPEIKKEGVRVILKIYNLRGQRIKTLVDKIEGPGYYKVHWNGRDDRGERVGSGVYFYRIEAGDFMSTKKLVVLK